MHFATNEESRNDSRTTCTEHARAWRHTPKRHKRKHTHKTHLQYMEIYLWMFMNMLHYSCTVLFSQVHF